MPVEMTVDSVRIDLLARHRLLVLKDVTRERYLPIAIGAAEASAIAIKLMNAEVLRPLSHDLLCNVVTTLGGRITGVLIIDVVRGTFYARIMLDVEGRHVEIDARPSDAVALALRTGTPIYVEEAVLERAAFVPEPPPEEEVPGEPRLTDEQLAAFRKVINQLDLDDL
jgi:bifunctional DNase/RNase